MGQHPDDITHLKEELASVRTRLDRIEWFLASFSRTQPVTVDSLMSDERLVEAAQLILDYNHVSVSMLQRHLDIGYARAARMLDLLKQRGLIAAPDGTSKPRKVHKDKVQAYLDEHQPET